MKRRLAPAKQTGAALLTAMLTVTLVATFAATALWQQWRNVEVELAERNRAQMRWLLTGAQDWARLILREDARSGTTDHLAEPWAIPLQESRLSSFLAVDKNNRTPEQDLFLSGQITDLQSRLNVFNLVEGNKVYEPVLQSFGKLFDALSLPLSELDLLSSNLILASDSFAAQAPLMPQTLEQLVWLGLSDKSLQILKPYICWLPERTQVNINTASAMVIYASVAELELNEANGMVRARANQHFRTLADAAKTLQNYSDRLGVGSRYFEIRGRLRVGQTTVEERSLVRRDGIEVKTVWRERAVLSELAHSHVSSLQ